MLSFGAKLSHMVMTFMKAYTYPTYAKANQLIWFQSTFAPNAVFGHFIHGKSVKINIFHTFLSNSNSCLVTANSTFLRMYEKMAGKYGSGSKAFVLY